MHRLAPVLLIGAALLLATSLGAPASPTVAPASAIPAAMFLDEQASGVLTEVNLQVERLRERLASPPPPPSPTRDPFAFGRRMPIPAEGDAEPVAVAPPPPPPLPRLVGVVAETIDGALVRRAFVSYGDAVLPIVVGDTLGPFVVRAIGPDGVELVNPARETSHVLRIR